MEFSAWIGTDKGALKGVDVSKAQFRNCGPKQELDTRKEIRSLQWNNELETELLLGQRDGIVIKFIVEKDAFEIVSDTSSVFAREDDFMAGALWISKEDLLLTCTTSGRLLIKNIREGSIVGDVHVGSHVACLCQNFGEHCQVAVGGHENDLKVYNVRHLESNFKPFFQAKNVRNDFVDLRVPISVTVTAFFPSSSDQPKLIAGTADSHVRLYDTRSQRRPVLSTKHGEAAITALDILSNGVAVIVGTAHGTMSNLDLRKSLACSGSFKGAAGSITDIKSSGSYITSCGLDRHFRIHHIDMQKPLRKVYIKQQASRIVLSSHFIQSLSSKPHVNPDTGIHSNKQREVAVSANELGAQTLDAIWQTMDVVSEPSCKKPRLLKKL
ncbi:WD repeat-containing protein 74-like [Corticium candelabrum]|uniref:WD repeat-containing protein 74-like n=1 Tax=Corticium candelabrum TaxID=121492 RepID=UPI002E271B8F|nr:WD repeat-containing protein 74-like [Corticium candelabrum]